jgi:glutamate-ammonia-ligase adenylyltransferase
MRARIAAVRPGAGGLDVKSGPGRLMDIELCAQMRALIAGTPARSVEDQIAAGASVGTDALRSAYRLFWQVQSAVRLLTDRDPDPDALGEGGRAFVLRETGMTTMPMLLVAIADAAGLAGAAISAQLAP